MDEKEFKKHLQDLVHGHHHRDEHEWNADTVQGGGEQIEAASAESPVKAKRKPPKRARASASKHKRASG